MFDSRKFLQNRVFLSVALASWLGLVVFAGWKLNQYSFTPGVSAISPMQWPKEAAIKLSSETATLLLFGHPECPCTLASMGELSKLKAKLGERIAVRVLFVAEDGGRAAIAGAIERTRQALPNVEVLHDLGASEARRFGARTSGQVFVYSPAGERIFQGGITSARGHEGDNVGAQTIANLVLHGRNLASFPSETPVFGCALFSENTASEAKR